ncbi:hypothetical protein [Delftia sp. WY8]|uniref:hypothetical protein n=1 Tax=Delftia sp. WY8 TaxID=2708352 RepID=UPI001BCAEE71|nr:hypothetical protein [Delftia sp. WY8]
MGLFSMFNRQKAPLQVGETSGDRIGCYLFGIEMPDGSDPSYHSLAVNRQELLEDCMEFFNQLANKKKALVEQGTPTAPRHAQDLKVIINAINNLPMFIDMHLKQNKNNGEPFLRVAGMTIFLRTGERQRQKIHGKYVE